MPTVKSKGGKVSHFPYTPAGEMAAKKAAKKSGGKMSMKKKGKKSMPPMGY